MRGVAGHSYRPGPTAAGRSSCSLPDFGGVVPARISVQKSDTFLKAGPPGVSMDVFVTATGQGHLNGAGTIGPWQQELSTSVNKDLDIIWAGDAKPADQLKVVAANATAKLKQLVT